MSMTPNELAELLNEINEKHSFYDMDNPDNKKVKYLDIQSCMDTRDGKIWIVEIRMRDIIDSKSKLDQENENIVFTEDDCTKDEILNWLRCNT